ncbi:PIN domain nuclease of toxin-antitoxin system [Rhizobium leguminosarum]|nr:PIN domain nuclease of toxin-antitoxin system [Rhizobium leguminosarum]
MKALLDSHAVYWWTIDSDRLSQKARSLIEDKANTILVSAVSFYELDNKMRIKKLDLKPQELRAAVTASGLQTLDIMPNWRPASTGTIAIHGIGSSRPRLAWNIATSFPPMSCSTRCCMNGSGKGQQW